jgi:hypothetical protein
MGIMCGGPGSAGVPEVRTDADLFAAVSANRPDSSAAGGGRGPQLLLGTDEGAVVVYPITAALLEPLPEVRLNPHAPETETEPEAEPENKGSVQ